MMRYTWTIPDLSGNGNCVLRVRYNMTSSDYWGYDTGTSYVALKAKAK